MDLSHLEKKFNNNNNEDKMSQILKLGEDTAHSIEEEKNDNITTPSLDVLFTKKKKKKGTNIYLSEDVFNKVVTLSMESGESLTSVMEKIITATVQDVKIKQHLVREYNNKMEKKRQPKNTNK
ncbi:MAG: hypothetical protein ACLS90_05525 [Clostridia bacterium]|mgnify:CR=1 FL=1